MKNFILVVFLFVSQFAFSQSDSTFNFPKSVGWVNDFEQILTIEQEKELSKIISRFEKETSNEIAIVTISSIAPYNNMADYANDLFNNWGIGKKEKDNGLLIIISRSHREIRIATGLGTEKILTDEVCKNIIDTKMVPYFKIGNYFQGIRDGLNESIKKWK